MSTTIAILLFSGIAAVYFAIGLFVMPTIRLPLPPPLLYALRASAVVFFLGCGATHAHQAAHANNPEYAELLLSVHSLVIHLPQFLAALTFLGFAFWSLKYIDIKVEAVNQDYSKAEAKATNGDDG